jgi:hemerythrin-like domain-containing protein
MSTTSTDTVRPVRLPGQTAAHPGPVDMTMMYVMHHAFRRDLATLAAAAATTPATDRRAWVALAERWELFSETLHHHHSGEDAGLWPALLERADVDERVVLEAMEAEHADIDPLLEACADGFARLTAQTDEPARAALAVRLVAAREHLAAHLRHEETEAIAIIQRRLTQAEWEAIDEEHFKSDLSFGQIVRMVPWVLDGLPADVRRQLFSGPGGGGYRLVWLLTRGGYTRRQRRALAHLSA